MEFNHDTETITPDNAENLLTISGVGALVVPVGGSGDRPANLTGMIRYNTDITALELNDGASWTPVSGTAGTPDIKVAATSVNLAAGDYVNIYNNGGVTTVRHADSVLNRAAHGFVLAATTSPANATVYFEGDNANRTGLTIGARQYLSTNGQTTETPVTSGTHQFLGIATSTTSINTDIAEEITFA